MNRLGRLTAVGLLSLPGVLTACYSSDPTPDMALVEPAPVTRPTTKLTTRRATSRPAISAEVLATTAGRLRQQYASPTDQWPKADIDPSVHFQELGNLPVVVYPATNPFSAEKESLGRQLFFDPRVSGSGQIACASCHDPDLSWADGRTVSFGHGRQSLRRNAPSVMFAAYMSTQFWDGRSGSLEDQATVPVVAHDEMNGGAENAAAKRLDAIAGYRKQFKAVFGADRVTIEDAAKAIATFERSIPKTAGRSPFDHFLKGETNVLPDAAVRGLNLFRTTGRCINCHSGPLLSDNQFHNIGLTYYGRKYEDLGRYEATNVDGDVGKFRTPSLRNVGRTRPYMHNGLFELDGIISAYNAGMPTARPTTKQKDDPMFPVKDSILRPLGLTPQDKDDLRSFLESLSEPIQRIRPPALPE